MSEYDKVMKEAMSTIVAEKYTKCMFGDIFLEDLKAYRDTKLAEVGITGVYPLWKQDTKALLQEFLSLGFKAITVCVNAQYLDKSFVGRVIDEQFITDLPDNVDVCGNRDVAYARPLHSDRILRFMNNRGQNVSNMSLRSLDTTEPQGALQEIQIYPVLETMPLTQGEKIVNLELNSTAGAKDVIFFKELVRTI